jgi:hypothetical protein
VERDTVCVDEFGGSQLYENMKKEGLVMGAARSTDE